MFKRKLLNILVGPLMLLTMTSSWANWCTVTHLKFNNEYIKMKMEGDPFKIGTLDSTGHTMALVVDGATFEYKYLRDIQVDGIAFREFRNESMIFQLALPGKGGVMLYSRFTKDSSGTERGFSGICSGS